MRAKAITRWVAAKRQEEAAIANRRQIQVEILSEMELNANNPGRHSVDDLTIVLSHRREWDQRALNEIIMNIDPDDWPFATHYREERSKSRALERDKPEIWNYVATALTLNPAAPSFALKKGAGQ